jgi:hypothetical protein
MSETIVIATCVNLDGRKVSIYQLGRSYLVSDKPVQGCAHDRGWKVQKIEPDLYGYVCNCGCGTISASNPDDPTAVRYVRHVPGPDDKVLPPIDYKAGEL